MRTPKLLSLIIAAYIAIGIIAFPFWWYETLARGDVYGFLGEAFGHYFYQNLTLVLALTFIGYVYHQGQQNPGILTTRTNVFVDSKLGIGLVWGLFLLGVARALFVGIDSQPRKRGSLEYAEPKVARADKSISLPIELLFADRTKISDTFGQIQGELKLTEEKRSLKSTAEAEGSGSVGIATVGVKGTKEGEKSSTYAAIEPNEAVKVVKTIEYMDQRQSLLRIQSVELQSSALKEFEKATELLSNKHSITLPKQAVEARKRVLIEENLKQSAPKEFAIGSWILIDGKVSVSSNGRTTQLKFEYVPSLPSRVSFACSIPPADQKATTALSSKEAQALDMRVFGKIASVNSQPSQVQYSISCYAAFR